MSARLFEEEISIHTVSPTSFIGSDSVTSVSSPAKLKMVQRKCLKWKYRHSRNCALRRQLRVIIFLFKYPLFQGFLQEVCNQFIFCFCYVSMRFARLMPGHGAFTNIFTCLDIPEVGRFHRSEPGTKFLLQRPQTG